MAETKAAAATVPTHPPVEVGKAKATKQADKVSGPDIFDAETHDPPLRSHSPQTPLAPALAEGAGQHMPPTDPHIGADGRWYADAADARTASAGYLSDEELDARYGKAK